MNLQTLTDEELAEHAVAIQIEKERRDKLAQIPATINALKDEYVNAGGDLAELETAVAP